MLCHTIMYVRDVRNKLRERSCELPESIDGSVGERVGVGLHPSPVSTKAFSSTGMPRKGPNTWLRLRRVCPRGAPWPGRQAFAQLLRPLSGLHRGIPSAVRQAAP